MLGRSMKQIYTLHTKRVESLFRPFHFNKAEFTHEISKINIIKSINHFIYYIVNNHIKSK